MIKIAPATINIVAIDFLNKLCSLKRFPPTIIAKKIDSLLMDKTSATGAILTACICVYL